MRKYGHVSEASPVLPVPVFLPPLSTAFNHPLPELPTALEPEVVSHRSLPTSVPATPMDDTIDRIGRETDEEKDKYEDKYEYEDEDEDEDGDEDEDEDMSDGHPVFQYRGNYSLPQSETSSMYTDGPTPSTASPPVITLGGGNEDGGGGRYVVNELRPVSSVSLVPNLSTPRPRVTSFESLSTDYVPFAYHDPTGAAASVRLASPFEHPPSTGYPAPVGASSSSERTTPVGMYPPVSRAPPLVPAYPAPVGSASSFGRTTPVGMYPPVSRATPLGPSAPSQPALSLGYSAPVGAASSFGRTTPVGMYPPVSRATPSHFEPTFSTPGRTTPVAHGTNKI
ncbi:hypothetical protein EST38_g6801 [Candolleomyces aberdarensis]|uniref:Uncharacterized protein n=1 Tax=Candolleomyces aberdarensis TaxID=2316362 RepID=A0A4Q2DIT2_9AGAR|nr:hypothetical protein EST38_g6801 [Candolleomyces aberdarensis]